MYKRQVLRIIMLKGIPKVASARIGAIYVFNNPSFENIIYREVRTNVDGSICVIRKKSTNALRAPNRNRARP